MSAGRQRPKPAVVARWVAAVAQTEPSDRSKRAAYARSRGCAATNLRIHGLNERGELGAWGAGK